MGPAVGPSPSPSTPPHGVVTAASRGELLRVAANAPTTGMGRGSVADALFQDLALGSAVAVVAGSTQVSRPVMETFLLEGFQRGERAIVLTLADSAEEVRREFVRRQRDAPQAPGMEDVLWVDGSPGRPPTLPPQLPAEERGSEPLSYVELLGGFLARLRAADTKGSPPIRVVVLGVSSRLARPDHRVGYVFLRNLVGLLKSRRALLALELETPQEGGVPIEPVTSRTDRVCELRRERDRTLFRLAGPGSSIGSDWFELPAHGVEPPPLLSVAAR